MPETYAAMCTRAVRPLESQPFWENAPRLWHQRLIRYALGHAEPTIGFITCIQSTYFGASELPRCSAPTQKSTPTRHKPVSCLEENLGLCSTRTE